VTEKELIDKLTPAIAASLNLEEQFATLKTAIEEAKAAGNSEAVAKNTATLAEFTAKLEELSKAMPENKTPPMTKDEKADAANENPLWMSKHKSLQHFLYDMTLEARGDLTDEMMDWKKTVRANPYGRTKATQTVGAMETGGALMPIGFSTEVFRRTAAINPIMRKARVIPMEAASLDIPYIAGFDESQLTYFGNVRWYWTGEGATMTSTNFETGTITLRLNELTGMVTVTNLLIRHSPTSVKSIIDDAFAYGMSKAITRACIRGTGASMPEGVLNANAKVEVAKETGQAADTITYRNLLDMLARLYSPDGGMGDGTWYASKTCMPTLGEITIGVGTGGSALFPMNDQVQAAPVWKLLGMDIEFNPLMSIAGDAGDIAVIDWGQYIIGQFGNGGVDSEQSIHLYFDTNKTAFRFVTEMDGKLWWPEKMKPEYGDSQSPVVTLAARA